MRLAPGLIDTGFPAAAERRPRVHGAPYGDDAATPGEVTPEEVAAASIVLERRPPAASYRTYFGGRGGTASRTVAERCGVVTGAGGFIGRALVRNSSDGHEVVAIDTQSVGRTVSRAICATRPCSPPLFQSGCEAVIHLATVPGGAAERTPTCVARSMSMRPGR